MQRTRILAVFLVLLSPLITYALDANSDLIKAAEKGDVAKVKALLAKGADPNAKGKNGWTALMFAVVAGRAAIAQSGAVSKS